MFAEVDADGSGTLSYREVRRALDLASMDSDFSLLISRWEDRYGSFKLSHIDADSKDGLVTVDEFKRFVVKALND